MSEPFTTEELLEIAERAGQMKDNPFARQLRGLAMGAAFNPECEALLRKKLDALQRFLKGMVEFWNGLGPETRATLIAEGLLAQEAETAPQSEPFHE